MTGAHRQKPEFQNHQMNNSFFGDENPLKPEHGLMSDTKNHHFGSLHDCGCCLTPFKAHLTS